MQEESVRLSVGSFDAATGKWIRTNPLPQPIDQDALTIATFNIWFGEHFARERYHAIASILETHRPDFIALQEVTPDALTLFLDQQWIQQEYRSIDIDGTTVYNYGVLILSRLPLNTITLTPLPSFMGRRLLVVETEVNGAPLSVATVHLESLKSSADIRGHQLRAIFSSLKNAPNVIIMGDFNFCASWAVKLVLYLRRTFGDCNVDAIGQLHMAK
jgi:tyrosyl-DNA phosphodiesterase 2